jgi:hypothetical protein
MISIISIITCDAEVQVRQATQPSERWFLSTCVLELIEINQSTRRRLHLLKLCRACIVQVSEKLFVAANMIIECHHFDLLNSCC